MMDGSNFGGPPSDDDTPSPRAGLRWETVQHLYSINTNSSPPNNLLLVGEIGLELADPVKIWAGVPIDMDPTGRKLLYDSTGVSASLPEAPTDGFIYGREGSNKSWQAVLPLYGGTLTGPLTIQSLTDATLHLEATGQSWAALTFNTPRNDTVSGYIEARRYGYPRWSIELGNRDTEAGANSGSNFVVNRYNDTPGNLLFPTAFRIDRNFGYAHFGSLVFLAVDPNTDLEAATKHYVDINSGKGVYLPLLGGTINPGPLNIESDYQTPALNLSGIAGIGVYTPIITMDVEGRGAATGIIQTKRSGFMRWQMTLGDGFTDESGFSVGTDFILSRFDDIGGLLSNVLTIERGTGDTVLAANINIEGYVTLSAGDPQHALEAATKNYVDTQIAKGQYLPLTGGNLTGPLSINPTGFNYPPRPGDQPLLTLVWTVGTGSINVGEFIVSAGGGEPGLTGVAAQGSMSSPVQVAFHQTLLRLAGRGHDGVAWTDDAALITLRAAEQWTAASHGTYLLFDVTRKGLLTPSGTQSMVLASSGNLILGANDPAFDDITHRLQVNGAATFTGSVDLQYYPTGATQAASKEYVDDQVKVVTGYLPLTGGQLSGGLSFGQRMAPGSPPVPSDTTQHISLFDGWGGFSITPNRLNIVHNGEAWFVSGTTDIARFTNVGLWFNPTYTIVLGRDPAFPYEAATMQWVTAQVSSGAFLPITGGTLTGNLQIRPPTGHAFLSLWGQQGYGATVNFFADSQRWEIGISVDPEIRPIGSPPANAGSNFAIYSYDDNGGFIGTPFSILRADGYVVVNNTIQVGRLPSQPMEVATMGYVTDQITAVQGAYLPLTGGTLTGDLTIKPVSGGAAFHLDSPGPGWPAVTWNAQVEGIAAGYFQSSRFGNPRWSVEFGGTERETGGDQGTNFVINRFHDDPAQGAIYPSPLAINRQLGIVTIATPLMLGGPPTAPNQAATMKYVTDTIAGGAFLPLSGGVMQGGISWADVWGQSPSDATHHIILHSGFGIGIYGPISSRMNFIAGATGTHAFINGVDTLYIDSTGLRMANNVDITLSRVPTGSNMAIPKSYADLMLPLAGGTMIGGLVFSNSNYNPVAGRPDLHNHIQLFAGYGFSITAGSLNIVTGGATWFSSSSTGQDIAFFADATVGLQMIGLRTVNLGRDPSDKMDAVTRQYADGLIGAAGGPFLPIAAGVGNALTGMLYLPHVTPTIDEQATPYFYVKAQDDNLQAQISAVVSGNLVFYGQLHVPHDVVHYKLSLNLPDGPLPPPTAYPKGAYFIVVEGGVPPTGTGTNIPPLPSGTPQYVRGDWFITDGDIWVFLPTGLVYFTADAVIVSPAIQGTTNVQDTLAWLNTNKLNLAGGTMQGPLYLATQPTTGSAAVRRDYLTTQLGGYLALTGGQMSGGITFGQNAGLTPPDTSKHITLWEASPGAGGYGIGVSPYRLNYMTPDIASYHVTMVGGIDVVRVDNTGLSMLGTTDIYIPRLPTSGFHAANRNYVDSRTPLAVDAPNDEWWYGRHKGAWSLVAPLILVGAGAYDLNAVPTWFQGLLSISNQTAPPNWPSDNWASCGFVLHGYNSNPGWANQLMMGPPATSNDAAIWYRNSYGGTWSPWWRVMTAVGGTFTGAVTINATLSLSAPAGTIPLVIYGNGINMTPDWGGAIGFNQLGGQCELDFFNRYNGARSFSWFNVTSNPTTVTQLGWFSPNGDFSVTGQVYLLGGAQSSPTQAASVKYVDDFLTRNHGPWLPLAAGAGYPLTGALYTPAIYMGTPLYIGSSASSAQLVFQGTPSSFRCISWATNAHTIWDIQTGGAESIDGTNAGSDLQFISFDDSGNPLYYALTLSRQTGYATVRGDPVTANGIANAHYVDAVRTLVTTNYLPLTAGQAYTVTGPLWVDNVVHIIGNTQVVPAQVGGSFISWNFSGGSGEVNFWNGGGGGDPGFNFRRVSGPGTQFNMANLDSGGNLWIAGALNIGAGQPSFGYQAANKDYVDAVRTLVTQNYLPLAGGTMQGGINMNSLATLQTDIMRGLVILDLGATNRFGFNVSFDGVGGHPAHLNYVVETNAVHSFLVNHVSIADIHGGGIDVYHGYLTLANDPTSNMHAVTLQYLNSQIAAGVRSFNTRTGFVTLTSLDVTNALTYTPVNRAGDTMTGALFVQVTPTTTTAQLDIGPPFGVGNSLEGKLRFRGTFGGTISDIGPRFTASLRSGYAGASAWGGEYLDVWMANGNPNDANSDINQVQVLRFLRNGINMPANMHVYLASDPTFPLEAATMQYADGVITRAGGPFLPTAGGTVTGNLLVDGVFYNDANRSSAGIVGGFGLALVNNVTQSEGEVDFVSRYIPYGGFRWYQIQTGNVFAPLMTLRPYGVLDLFSTGITYQGITHGGNAIAWAMYNNTVEAYVDGNFIGGLLTTAGGTLTGDLFIANNHKLGLLDAGGGQVYFTIGADNHFGFYSTAQNGATSVRVWDFYVRTDVSSQYFGLPTEFGSIVTIDGQLYVKGANPQLNIQGPAGTWRTIQFYSGASNRWNIQLDPNTESGNNVGSDLRFTSWSDAGGVLGVPLMIGRGTGKVTISSIASNDPLELVAPNGNWARIFSTVTGTRTWAFGTRNDGVFCISDENLQVFRLLIDSAGAASFGASVNISNAGGLHFGNKLAPTGPQDTSQHITLWDGGYGFSITGGTLNYTTGGAHDFYAGGLSARITGAGVWAFVPLTLAADPTTAMHAATKQYVDNNFTAIAAGGIHPSWLHVSGNTASYIPQGGYMMWNRSGGGMTNLVNNRGLGGGGFTFTDTNGTTDVPLLDMDSTGVRFRIGPTTLAADPTAAMHAVTRQWAIANLAPISGAGYVSKGGDTMSGALTIRMQPYPNIMFNSFGAGVDAKQVQEFIDTDGSYNIQFLNDANTVGGRFFQATRSGANPLAITLTAPNVYTSSTFRPAGQIWAGSDIVSLSGGIYPGYNTTGGAWFLYATSGEKHIKWTSDNWRLSYDNATGNLNYFNPTPSLMFQMGGNGRIWVSDAASLGYGVQYRRTCANFFEMYWDGTPHLYVDTTYIGPFAMQGWVNASFATYNWVNQYFKPIGAYTPNQNVDVNATVSWWDDHVGGTLYAQNVNATHQLSNINTAGFTCTYLVVNGDSNQNNIYVRGGLGLDFTGVYNSGVWYAFGWDGHLNIAINGGGQGQLAYVGDVTAVYNWVNANFFPSTSGSSNAQWGWHYSWSGEQIGFEWSGGFLWFHLNGGGGVYPLANAYCDARAKYDIAKSKLDCLAMVNAIPLFEYRWRPGDARWGPNHPKWQPPSDDDTPLVRVGIVAQECRRVFPESISGGYADDAPLGTDHNTLIAALIGAVQQLSAEVAELKAARTLH